jgi:RHH-type proline utilization regulon transcriptional repressor/proline dehydrogenase/delta 1-pyrroline-5-carboxylate dehydrogenase
MASTDFPVYTRKIYTDVSYVACARKLLAATDAVFPQFATHNAQTLATIYKWQAPTSRSARYEFQCLHGMGEPLYDEVVGRQNLDRPCRIYAPVGTHETLLAYLVRRLLENGANSSFVNRIADPAVSIDDLIADPGRYRRSHAGDGRPARQIKAAGRSLWPDAAIPPVSIFPTKRAVDAVRNLKASAAKSWPPRPHLWPTHGVAKPCGPQSGDHRDVVGSGHRDSRGRSSAECRRDRLAEGAKWAAVSPADRAALPRSRRRYHAGPYRTLLGLIIREAGKSLPNAIAEVREAIDFLRYYAEQARRTLGPAHQRLLARSSASARGTSRWPSSPARSRQRWSPAIRCWPSPPRKRR